MSKKEKEKLVSIQGTVAEMSDGSKFNIDVPLPKSVNVAELTEGDDEPMFVIIEALNESVSKNGRKYDSKTLQSVADQINTKKPDAYMGHLEDKDRPYKNPTSQTLWLGAKVNEVEGKKRLFVKGYVLPYAKELRQYLKAAKAVGKNVAVSVYGKAREVLDSVTNSNLVRDFNLESIDWARPGSEGIQTLGILGITKEMEQEKKDDNWESVLDTYSTVRESVENELREKIKKDHSTKLATIAEQLNVEESEIVNVVSEMKNTISRQERELTDHFINREIEEKIPTKTGRSVVKRLVIAEMGKGKYNRKRASNVIDSVLNSEETSEVLKEMSINLNLNPNYTPTESNRKYTVKK